MHFSRSSGGRIFCTNGFDTMDVVCTDLLRVVCIGLLLISAEFLTVNKDWVCLHFGMLETSIAFYRQIIPWLQIS